MYNTMLDFIYDFCICSWQIPNEIYPWHFQFRSRYRSWGLIWIRFLTYFWLSKLIDWINGNHGDWKHFNHRQLSRIVYSHGGNFFVLVMAGGWWWCWWSNIPPGGGITGRRHYSIRVGAASLHLANHHLPAAVLENDFSSFGETITSPPINPGSALGHA